MAVNKTDLARQTAEADLEAFIRLVHPGSVLGGIHQEVIRWMTSSTKKSHQLLLLPRDHQKSRLAAYYAAWRITQYPALRILYVSSTANLATKQIKFIKDILTSPIYQRYWPDMVNPDVGSREKWTESEFSVDHPMRRKEAVRDPTVFTAGLTTNIVGMHCDLAILDDVVTSENAYTEQGREQVKTKYSLLASIEGSDAEELVVGTRYFPTDLYNEMLDARVETFDEDGELLKSDPLYEVFIKTVETEGVFLWPRQQRPDGRWFGFNADILAKKKAQYRDKVQFRAQYYNDPNDLENAPISPELFQYYDARDLNRFEGKWLYQGRRLNVFAAIDFAYSTSKKADFSSLVVVGVDSLGHVYVLDIDRFKTGKISDYYAHILRAHQKWDFRKIRAEMTSAQQVIVNDLRDNYIRPHGLALTVEEHKPTRHEGHKEERINAALQPKYQNRQMYHKKSDGMTQLLEEELTREKPAHDDIKDCLASVMDIIVAPAYGYGQVSNIRRRPEEFAHTRFGGIL